jgi:hypothetical protein
LDLPLTAMARPGAITQPPAHNCLFCTRLPDKIAIKSVPHIRQRSERFGDSQAHRVSHAP